MKKILLAGVAAAVLTSSAPAFAASLWASDSGGGVSTIFELDATTGAILSSFGGPGLFADALSFANDGDSMFILDSSTNSDVYEVDLTGAVLNSFSLALDAEGLTVLADGTLVVGGGNSGVIAFVDSSTGAINSSFASTNVFGLASNGVDEIYGLTISGDILTYDLTGTLLSTLNTDATGTTLGLASNANGGWFIAATGSTIFEVDGTGSIINSYAGPGSFTEGLDFPQGVQVPGGIPEPATWAMLIFGFGMVGSALRRRKTTVKVSYA